MNTIKISCCAFIILFGLLNCSSGQFQDVSRKRANPIANVIGGTLIKILAAGSEGGEVMRLSIDEQPVATWTVNSGAYAAAFESFTFQSPGQITIDQIRVEFLNDIFDPENGVDRNLRIDAVIVNGERFETEALSVFSTGTWTAEVGIQDGFPESEVLHTNGYFQFNRPRTGSEIIMRASGDMGGETFELQIDGQSVQTFTATVGFQRFYYYATSPIAADRIRIEFTNDIYDPENGIDLNLNLDWLELDGERIQTENDNIFSTGTWTLEDGIQPGFGRGSTLHTDGYFAFAPREFSGEPSTIVVRASGDIGVEEFALLIDETVVERFVVATEFAEFVHVANETISPNRIRVAFTNDIFIPGLDRNLNVDWIQIDGTILETEDDSVFSTGTYTAEDGIRTGFGRGSTLHVQGYFEYGRTLDDQPVNLNGQPVFFRNGHQYVLSSAAGNWAAVQAEAESLGGNLVTINSAQEEDYLQRVFGSNALWIGISDLQIPGVFLWQNSEAAFYRNWNPGQPGGQRFGLMNTQENFQWDTASGVDAHFGIIEIVAD